MSETPATEPEVKEDDKMEVGEDSASTAANKNITVIKVKPMAATSTTEDTRLLCLVPVADPMAATSTTEEIEAGDSSRVSKNLAEIQAAQNEVRKLDVLVCGKCHTVFHFIEEFTLHKSDPTCTKPTYRTNINESKPQVWAFLLWKANVGRKLVDVSGDDSSSWGLYKRWCKLRPPIRDTWVAAGKAIQVSSALGAATIKEIHSYPVLNQTKKVKSVEDTFTYTDSVRADKGSTIIKKVVVSPRQLRSPVKRPLPVKVEEEAATQPRTKMARRSSTEADKPKATRSSSLRGKKPGGEESSEDENYVVEKILAKRFNPRIKQFEYLLKWEGYPQDQNTWEPVNHMAECDKLVETFERSLAKQKAKAAEAGHKVVTKVVKVPISVQPSTSKEGVGRPVRSSKTRAMENVKSWCGSIGGKGAVSDNSDSDDSEPKIKTEYFQYPDNSEENEDSKTPGLLKSLSLVKSPVRQKVLRAVNGDTKLGRPPGQTPPVLVANSKGVIKVDSRQVSTLSSGVYIVSNQAGVMKLSGQEQASASTQPRLLPKPSPAKGATGIVRIQSTPSPTAQKNKQILSPNPNMPGVRMPRPRPTNPRVLGPRTPTTSPRPRFVPRAPSNLRPPAKTQSPAAQVKSGVKPIQAMLGQQVVTVQSPVKSPVVQPRKTPDTQLRTTSKLSQLLNMPKNVKVTQSPLAPKTRVVLSPAATKARAVTTPAPVRKPPVKQRPKQPADMDMDFEDPDSEESEEEPVTPAFTGPDKTPSPLGSPLPLTLCPETGKILGQAEGEATPVASPEPDPGNILPDMEPPDEEEETGTMSGAGSNLGHDYAQQVDHEGVSITRVLEEEEEEGEAEVKTEVEEGAEGEYVTITGDDGVIYQIATNGANLVDGETMLMTEDGQQCVYVAGPGADTSADEANMLSLDSAVAEAVAQLGDAIGANSQIVMRGGDGGQILMTTGEEGAEERAAQVVAHIEEEGEPGGMRRVVLLLPDGNFMMTEVDAAQYAALDFDK